MASQYGNKPFPAHFKREGRYLNYGYPFKDETNLLTENILCSVK